MTQILKTLQSLPADKRRALVAMMARKGVDLFRDLPVTPADRARRLPLSFAQQRLWIVDQLEAEKAAYVIPGVFRLKGPLDRDALEKALQDLLDRHEALRTRFPALDREAVQVIEQDAALTLRSWSLHDVPEDDRQAQIDALCEAEAHAPFDLAGGPLVRCGLIELGGDDHILTLTLHHIVADGWSIDLLLRDLGHFYRARCLGRHPNLPAPAIQYADYALWQRFWMESGEAERQLQWWSSRLGETPEPVVLPLDRPRPLRRSGNGGSLRLELAENLMNRLSRQAERQRVTLPTLLLAAFFVLLYRHSGQARITIGVPMAGRDRVEFEVAVGLFVNTVPISLEVSGRQSCAGVLAQVHEAFLEAQDHQVLPFDLLVSRLQPERVSAHAPIVQVLFNHIPETASPELHGLEVSLLRQPRPAPKMDLTLTTEMTAAGLLLEFDYSADIFEAETVGNLGQRYCRVLEEMAARPLSKVGDVELLGAEEQRRLAAAWSCPTPLRRAPGARSTFLDLFSLQAGRRGAKPAVVQGEVSLTYGDLQRYSDGLAMVLSSRGIGAGDRVVLAAARCPETVVGLLGVMKTGAAAVPVDPQIAPQRLARITEICASSLVLSADPSLATDLPLLPLNLSALAKREAAFPVQPLDARQIAYVIFTSGSTGAPKGVAVSHGALAAYLEGVLARLELPAEASMAMVSTMAADLGHTVLFGALASGRVLQLFDDETARDPLLFAEAMQRHAVGVLKIVPSHLESLLIPGRESEAMPRSVLILGGEASPPGLIERLQAAAPECRIINHYGPTETTVGVVADEVALQGRMAGNIALGRPLPQARCFVLDGDLNFVPPGVSGELYVGGDCVAEGYVGGPSATAERFLPDFIGGSGQRLYRTGDRVRWLADGRLEYLGRFDRQVKVRGFRVEPGEIEACLGDLPGVRQVVVVDRGSDGEVRLIAYLVLRNPAEAEAELEAIELTLKSRLPSQMQPAALVPIDAVPLSANGKVDRKALPLPEVGRGSGEEALNTETERRIAAIWREVLGIPVVGAGDGFFNLGGHSLTATHIVSRVRQAFGIPLPLRSLFESPQLKEFARAVDEARQGRTAEGEPLAGTVETPAAAADGHPLSYAQERMWFFAQLEPETAIYNIAAALRLQGDLDPEALQAAFSDLVARHGALRTRYRLHEGEPRQLVEAETDCPIKRVDVSALPPEKRIAAAHEHAAQEARRPFDLEATPLARACLVRLSERDHVLLLTIHHIAADGWSIRILIRDFQELYAARAEGRGPQLGPVAAEYTDFAYWQRRHLEMGAAEWQLAYWRRHLGTEHPITTLPPDNGGGGGGRLAVHHEFCLGQESTQRLRTFAARHQYTVFMLVLAAFAVVLHQRTGERRLRFGGDIANRNDDRFAEVVGFFVNQLVLQLDFDPEVPFTDFLDQCRRIVIDGSEHQDLPFHHLVEALRPARRHGRSPFFNIKLIYQEGVHVTPNLPGLAVSPFPSGAQAAELDLVVAVINAPEGLQVRFTLPEDLYRFATIASVFQQMSVVLEAIPTSSAGDGAAALVAVAERVRAEQSAAGKREGAPAVGSDLPSIRRVARSGGTLQVS